MKKRTLPLFKKVLRFLIIALPYLYTVRRMVIDEIDNRLQRLVIRLLDKWDLHDYERIEEFEKCKML